MNTKTFKLPQFTAEVILPKQYNETKLVVAGGRTPEIPWLQEVAATKKLYCADKGIEVCLKANLVPTSLFGDGDSGSKEAYEKAQALGTKVESFPVEKDDTDLQLLLQNLEGSDLICTGVWAVGLITSTAMFFPYLVIKKNIKHKLSWQMIRKQCFQ